MELIINKIETPRFGLKQRDIILTTDEGRMIGITTSNMKLIDAMNSDDQDESDEAARVAVEMVLNKNGYNVESVISECGCCGRMYVATINEE